MNRRDAIRALAAWSVAGTMGSSAPALLAAKAPAEAGTLPRFTASDDDLLLPDGPATAGAGRNVEAIIAGANRPVICRLHAEVGPICVVMLPDGRFRAVDRRVVKTTTDPFKAASRESIAASLQQAFPKFRVRATRRYVFVYNTSDVFYKATSRILESIYPGVVTHCRTNKLKITEPEVPLIVTMFRTENEFRKYRTTPKGAVAYYNTVTNHVAMYEESTLHQVAPEIAVRQAISTVAHEGVHQILHNIGVQQRLSRWPMWISEGLPEYFAPTSTDRQLRWKGAGTLNELRLFSLSKYLQSRSPRARGELVEKTVQGAELTATGYAAAWALTHYLAQRQTEKFWSYIRHVSQIGPMSGANTVQRGLIAANRAEFVQFFGSDLAAIEDRVVEHLKQAMAKAS
jgi:hypothetical protein